MITQAQFEVNESRRLAKNLAAVEATKGQEAKDAREDFRVSLKTPGIIAERIGWLLNGSYGFAEMKRAKQILASKRSNRAAQFCILLAALDCDCKRSMAIAAWKSLPEDRKTELESEIQQAITEAEKEF